MNIVIIILLVIVILVAIILIAAALTDDEVIIEKEITINKPKQEVFNYIKLLKNENYYNKWVMMDPNSKRTYTGTDGTVGFVFAWDSENKQVGKGEHEIKGIKEGERIDTEIRFITPMENKATSWMITESVSVDQTKVKWGFRGGRTYKMKVIYLLLNLKKMLGDAFLESLENLKRVLEK